VTGAFRTGALGPGVQAMDRLHSDAVPCQAAVIYRGDGHARIESPDNTVAITLRASGWEKIDPLMAAFNAIAPM